MKARLMFVHALTPLHAGTGQGVGVIDLPVAREKATGLPYLPGSSVKGTLRDEFAPEGDEERNRDSLRVRIFGPETNRADEHAGAVQFTDQTLLLLPVRSLAGTFGWVTAPYVLERLSRDARVAGVGGVPADVPRPGDNGGAVVTADSALVQDGAGGKIYLEDLDLTSDAGQASAAGAWAGWLGTRIFPEDADWRRSLASRICVVHDDVFGFLLDTATEVSARIKMDDDSKTVDKKTGGLWYEESLPAETVLYGLTLAFPNECTVVNGERLTADAVLDHVRSRLSGALQFGGKATIGRGICRVLMGGAEAGA